MRLINKSIYALALASMMGFWSCSQDEMLDAGSTSPEGKTVRLTLSVSRTPETRTILSEDGEGGLLSEWKTTDKIGVMIPKIGKVGELDFVEFPEENNKKVAVFSGELEKNEYAQLQEAMLYYCDESVIDKVNSSKKIIKIPLHNQKFHSVGELSAMDVLYEHVTLNVKDQFATVTKDEVMKPVLAMAHFNLSTLPKNSEGTLYVSRCDEGKKIQNLAWLRTYDDGDLTTGFQDGSITELQAEVKKDHQVYMALPAQYSGGQYHEVTLSFRYVDNETNAEYTYSFTQPTRITAGVYYNSFEDGKASGINIPLESSDGVDHSKNPLLKWAKTNIDLTQPSGFAKEVWETGQYFQFGRNCGYADYKDAAKRYALYCSKSTNYPGDVWGFNIFNGNSFADYISASYTYGSNESSQPDSYFLISDSDISGSDTDWWKERASLGDTWSVRATAEGWTNGDPSPEGWRLATKADYLEIVPENLASADDQTQVFGRGAIKQIDDDYYYLVKWDIVKTDVEGNYPHGGQYRYLLKVSALVITSEVAKTVTSLDRLKQLMENNNNIVVRYFPATGYIQPNYVRSYVSYRLNNNGSYDFSASEEGTKPWNYTGLGWYRFCKPRPTGRTNVNATLYNRDLSKVYLYIDESTCEDYSNLIASYWTSDGENFGFSYDFTEEYPVPYYISFYINWPKFYGMPLRCVRAD